MWKYVRFFNSSRFLAFEPFEFWIISVSEVLFDSDSLPFPLFHVQCYSMQVIAMQDVFNKFDKDTTTVQHRSWMWQRSDSPTIQPVETESECWDKLRQRLPRKRRVRTPELHDGWRDVCLTRNRSGTVERRELAKIIAEYFPEAIHLNLTFPYSIDSFTEKASQKCLICRAFRQQSPECLGIR